MSSRIRARRYRNIDPDERYGFSSGPASTAASSDPLVLTADPVSVQPLAIGSGTGGVSTPDGTTVLMDGTAVTIEPGTPILESSTVILEPRIVPGASRTEG
jgi:hypothetical protein